MACLRLAGPRRMLKCLLTAGVAAASIFGFASATIAYADVPAITDFGQEAAQPTLTSDKRHNAVFFTLYADGHGQVQVRTVRGDAVVSFAGEHPVWRLDHGLMWFVQMPVYVRELSKAEANSGTQIV